MEVVPCVYHLAVLMILGSIRYSEQGPIRDRLPIPSHVQSAEDSVFVPDVAPVTADPLENIGVELSQGYLVEGDIRMRHGFFPKKAMTTATQSRAYLSYSTGSRINSHQIRNSISTEESWLERVIPYVIDPWFNSTEQQTVRDALQEIRVAVNNCLLFVPREQHFDFLYITGQQSGCWSDVGKQGGNQTVSISRASNCVTKGIVMHELLHALGFWHEHNRRDRNNYIEILTHNIRIDHVSDFTINQNGKILVNEYDYYSIMHYKTNQFSKSHQTLNTIRIIQTGINETQVGQREYLSGYDKERIVRLYQCRKFVRSASKDPFRPNQLQPMNTGVPFAFMLSSPRTNATATTKKSEILTHFSQSPLSGRHSEEVIDALLGSVTAKTNTPESDLNKTLIETEELGRK